MDVTCQWFAQAITAAGLLSGLIEGLAINPFEVVKVTLQSDRHQFKDVGAALRSQIVYKSSPTGAQKELDDTLWLLPFVPASP